MVYFGVYRKSRHSQASFFKAPDDISTDINGTFFLRNQGNQENQDSRTEKESLRLSEDQQKQRNQKIKPVSDTNLTKICTEDAGELFGKLWVLSLFLDAIGIITAPWAPRESEQAHTPSCPQTGFSPTRHSLGLSTT